MPYMIVILGYSQSFLKIHLILQYCNEIKRGAGRKKGQLLLSVIEISQFRLLPSRFISTSRQRYSYFPFSTFLK